MTTQQTILKTIRYQRRIQVMLEQLTDNPEVLEQFVRESALEDSSKDNESVRWILEYLEG